MCAVEAKKRAKITPIHQLQFRLGFTGSQFILVVLMFFKKHNHMYTLIVRLEALHRNSTICFTCTITPSQGDINHVR